MEDKRQVGRRTPPFGHDRLDTLYRYWDERRAGRAAPSRADIDPLELPPDMLPFIALLEVEPGPPPDVRIKLFGTELVEAMGQDPTGRLWREVIAELPGPIPDEVMADLDGIDKACHPHFVDRTGDWAGKDHIRYRRLALPLSSDGRTVDMFVAVVAFV